MRVVFFVPLCAILLYESHLDPARNRWVKDWFSSPDEGGEDAPHWRDPEVGGEDAARGLRISKVPFEELVAMFPDTTHVSGFFRALHALEVRWGWYADHVCVAYAVGRGGGHEGVQGVEGGDCGAEAADQGYGC